MSVGIVVGLLLAGTGALAMNVGAVLKYRGANSVPAFEVRRPVRSARALVRSGWFAIGLAVAQLGGGLHIAALALAPISIVQAVLAAGVVVLGAAAERLLGSRVSGRQRLGLLVTAGGLVMLVVSVPRLGAAHGVFATQTMVAFELIVAVTGAVLAVGHRGGRLTAHSGVMLGAAAGTFFGLSDVAVKAITGGLEHGDGVLAMAPWLVVAIGGGVIAQILAIRALQEGEAVPVIALTGVASSLANIAGGVVVFGDPMAERPLGLALQSFGFLLLVAGAALVPAVTATLDERTGRARPAPSV